MPRKEPTVPKVAVMTDGGASFPLKMQREYVKVIPLHITMDGKDYLETEINMNELYSRLREKMNLPTTSAPSVREFLKFFQELSRKAEAILHISMTSAFTGGYDAALEAKELAWKKLPNTTVEVIDSKCTGPSQVLLVLEAARAAAQGKNINEVKEFAIDMIPRLNNLSTRDTLFYLDKGGRIFEAKSWAEAEGKASFRSIVEIDDHSGGVTKPVARAKTKAQIIEKMVEIARERVGDKKLHFAIDHANIPEQAEQLKQRILSSFQCSELYITEAWPAAAIHNGEGLIEFGFYCTEQSYLQRRPT